MVISCPCGQQYDADPSTGVTIVRCPRCRTGATLPPPARDVYGDGLFSDEHAGYGGARLNQQPQWLHEAGLRLEWIRPVLEPGASILEIGSATGEFVATAERAGYDVAGLETSPQAAEQARRLTAKVERRDLAAWRAANQGRHPDAIAMFHVLEHFADPVDFLRQVLDALAPGGRLFLEVPNGGSRRARVEGVNWWAARTEDHYFHFSRRGLELALRNAGFVGTEVHAVNHDVYVSLTARQRVGKSAKEMVKSLSGRPAYARDLLRAVATKR